MDCRAVDRAASSNGWLILRHQEEAIAWLMKAKEELGEK